MLKILYVGLGGFAGAVARYFIQTHLPHRPGSYPWGTFLVNIAGCLLIGIIYGIAEKNKVMTHELRLLLVIGFCGSFTTFSTFAAENLNLLQLGNYLNVAVNIILSVVLGLAAVYTGIFFTRGY